MCWDHRVYCRRCRRDCCYCCYCGNWRERKCKSVCFLLYCIYCYFECVLYSVCLSVCCVAHGKSKCKNISNPKNAKPKPCFQTKYEQCEHPNRYTFSSSSLQCTLCILWNCRIMDWKIGIDKRMYIKWRYKTYSNASHIS